MIQTHYWQAILFAFPYHATRMSPYYSSFHHFIVFALKTNKLFLLKYALRFLWPAPV